MKPILHQAIRIQVKPSHLMWVLQGLISILSCWILVVMPIALPIKLVMIGLVVTSSLYFVLRDTLQMLPWSWQVLEINNKGQLSLINRRGQQFEPALAESTFIHAQLTIINFQRKGYRLGLPPVILLTGLVNKDIANEDQVRRLRVWLRWAKQHNLQYQNQQYQDEVSD
ncbi:MAG TPA: hypothetical protein VK952_04550 [Methylotenera sp.]|nr:hypothetical protein [Methylotenera sp.]